MTKWPSEEGRDYHILKQILMGLGVPQWPDTGNSSQAQDIHLNWSYQPTGIILYYAKLAIICNAHLGTEQSSTFVYKISTNFIVLKVFLLSLHVMKHLIKLYLHMVITTVLWFVSIFLSVSVILLSHYQPVPGGHHVTSESRHITTATQTFLTQFLNCRPAALLYFSQSDNI